MLQDFLKNWEEFFETRTIEEHILNSYIQTCPHTNGIKGWADDKLDTHVHLPTTVVCYSQLDI